MPINNIKNYDFQTIISISTSNSINSPIGVIRASGPLIGKIINKFFITKKIKKRYAYYVKFKYNNKIYDEGILIYYEKPYSFTSEDMFEFFCHGNVILMKKIVNIILKSYQYIRQSYNGEFLYRAVLNGKIDLLKAESINDLINTTSEVELLLLNNNIYKDLFQKDLVRINNWLEKIYLISEVCLSFSDSDDINIKIENIKIKHNNLLKFVNNLLETCFVSKNVIDGITIAIIGDTNVGKSSILNKISSQNIVIVDESPGTTRDIIKSEIYINKQKVIFYDTAGFRKTENKVEKKGIVLSIKCAKECDYIWCVFEKKQNLKELKKIFCKYNINEKKITYINNKIDLYYKSNQCFIKNNLLYISTFDRNCKQFLKKFVSDKYLNKNIESLFYVKRYHIEFLEEMKNKLAFSSKFVNEKNLDIYINNLFEIKNKLMFLLGKKILENEYINKIFSQFCIGK